MAPMLAKRGADGRRAPGRLEKLSDDCVDPCDDLRDGPTARTVAEPADADARLDLPAACLHGPQPQGARRRVQRALRRLRAADGPRLPPGSGEGCLYGAPQRA